ncbi:10210_t:CDS:2, partial [Cetraspora pellucida]
KPPHGSLNITCCHSEVVVLDSFSYNRYKRFRFRAVYRPSSEFLSLGVSVDKQLSDNILSVIHSTLYQKIITKLLVLFIKTVDLVSGSDLKVSYSVERFAEPFPVTLSATDDMSSKSRQKQPAFKGISASDEMKYKRKYRELKKKIREMEEENEKLTLKLTKAKKNIQRLKIERSFLFDRLEQSQPTNESESEPSSSPQRVIDSEEELSSVGSDDNDDNAKFGAFKEGSELLRQFIDKKGKFQEELLEDQRAGKRRRQNRDPNAPKRPRNAFLMYCQMQREQAREENQNKGFQDVTRILSQRWKELPLEEKGKYYDMYKQERQRYEKEMSTYVGGINSDYGDELDSVSEEMVDELAADRDANGWLGTAHELS